MKPNKDQISQMFEHVRYEIESFLLDPIYDKTNASLKESVFFRKMAHCRVLYGFFAEEKLNKNGDRRDDDVWCNDFGFKREDLYGNQPRPLLDLFNKRLFHLTYARLDYTAEKKRWARETLFPPVVKQAKKFIEHVLAKQDLEMSDTERKLWTKLKTDIAAGNPLQQNTSNVAEPKHWDTNVVLRAT